MGEARCLQPPFQFWQSGATKDHHLSDQTLCPLEALATAKGIKIVGKKERTE
jgi:hypothetical protein